MTDDAKIVEAAKRYVRAQSDRKRITRERNGMDCERVAAPFETRQEHPCWKMLHDKPDEGYAGGWVSANDEPDPAEWCASCRRRRELHAELAAAGREVVAAFNSLRRSVTGSKS